MNIQIFGTKKSSETKKAQRWFKERSIAFHFVSLDEKGISPGELDSVLRKYDAEDLIDTNSKAYKKKNLAYMDYDAREEILDDPLLLLMPLIRNGSEVSLGYAPDTWKSWTNK